MKVILWAKLLEVQHIISKKNILEHLWEYTETIGKSLFLLVSVFENKRVESVINESKEGHDSTILYEIFHGECFNDYFDGCFL